jgi:hypothetical protein
MFYHFPSTIFRFGLGVQYNYFFSFFLFQLIGFLYVLLWGHLGGLQTRAKNESGTSTSQSPGRYDRTLRKTHSRCFTGGLPRTACMSNLICISSQPGFSLEVLHTRTNRTYFCLHRKLSDLHGLPANCLVHDLARSGVSPSFHQTYFRWYAFKVFESSVSLRFVQALVTVVSAPSVVY